MIKRNLIKWLLPVVLFLTGLPVVQAQKTPNQLLNGVYRKMMQVKDYTVQANIKVDMPFVKIMPVNAKIFFKQKDKFKVESKSIAIVPRQSMAQISGMLRDTNSFTAVRSGAENIAQRPTVILSIIPASDTGDLILAKLWVDPERNLVMKTQFTTKSSGTVLAEYTYGTQATYGLPDQIVFTVDIKKFKIPKSVSADINMTETMGKKPKDGKGRITIRLTGYQINKGISDKVFKN